MATIWSPAGKRKDVVFPKHSQQVLRLDARRMTGIQLHDFNCGLKAYRKDVVKSIEAVRRNALPHTRPGEMGGL